MTVLIPSSNENAPHKGEDDDWQLLFLFFVESRRERDEPAE